MFGVVIEDHNDRPKKAWSLMAESASGGGDSKWFDSWTLQNGSCVHCPS